MKSKRIIQNMALAMTLAVSGSALFPIMASAKSSTQDIDKQVKTGKPVFKLGCRDSNYVVDSGSDEGRLKQAQVN